MNCEIMTRQAMYDRGISRQFHREEDMDEILFVRWSERVVQYQTLDSLIELLDALDVFYDSA